jgi:ubiquinone/menaquinone biosynthesis C-methylase UbiE
MELTRSKKNWEELGQQDPMWAILSDPSKKGRRWDPAAFFKTGEGDVNGLLDEIRVAEFPLQRGTALDFGCGLGRLTQALCRHFDKCYGVDISSTMLAEANRYNRFGAACEYVLNSASDLRCFADDSFDFIYSHLVLQHIPPEAGIQYVAEFVRVLKVGGLLIFQAPSEQRSVQEQPVMTPAAPEPVAAATEEPPASPAPSTSLYENMEKLIDMHALPRKQVVAAIEQAGGRILQVQEYNSAGPEWLSFRYWVTKSRS